MQEDVTKSHVPGHNIRMQIKFRKRIKIRKQDFQITTSSWKVEINKLYRKEPVPNSDQKHALINTGRKFLCLSSFEADFWNKLFEVK